MRPRELIRPWCLELCPYGVDEASRLKNREKWLDEVCQFIWRNIHGANYDSEIFDLVLDCVVAGWGVMYADVDRHAGGGYVFQTWDIGQSYLASTRQDQKVDTLYREYEMTMAALVNESGENRVSEEVRKTRKSKATLQVRCPCAYVRSVTLPSQLAPRT